MKWLKSDSVFLFFVLGYTPLILQIVRIIMHTVDDVTPTQLCILLPASFFFSDAHLLQSKPELHSQGCPYTMQINANNISHGNTISMQSPRSISYRT